MSSEPAVDAAPTKAAAKPVTATRRCDRSWPGATSCSPRTRRPCCSASPSSPRRGRDVQPRSWAATSPRTASTSSWRSPSSFRFPPAICGCWSRSGSSAPRCSSTRRPTSISARRLLVDWAHDFVPELPDDEDPVFDPQAARRLVAQIANLRAALAAAALDRTSRRGGRGPARTVAPHARRPRPHLVRHPDRRHAVPHDQPGPPPDPDPSGVAGHHGEPRRSGPRAAPRGSAQ